MFLFSLHMDRTTVYSCVVWCAQLLKLAKAVFKTYFQI